MAAKPKEYQRLQGRGVRGLRIVAVSRTRLWLGGDHLLSVDSQWFNESYKRFYFRDIQALIIRQTSLGKVINIVLAALAFLPLLAALSYGLSSNGEYGLALFWGVLAGLLLIGLAINTIMGPTCVCQVKTAVQTEEFPSLNRLWRARKVLRRVTPFVVEAQGDFPVASTAAEPIPAAGHVAATQEPGEVSSALGQNPDPLQPPAGT